MTVVGNLLRRARRPAAVVHAYGMIALWAGFLSRCLSTGEHLLAVFALTGVVGWVLFLVDFFRREGTVLVGASPPEEVTLTDETTVPCGLFAPSSGRVVAVARSREDVYREAELLRLRPWFVSWKDWDKQVRGDRRS